MVVELIRLPNMPGYGLITVSILVVWKANGFYARGSVNAFKIASPSKSDGTVVTILCIASNISFAKFQIGYAL